MMYLILFFVFILTLPVTTQVMYLAIMSLQQARDSKRLSPFMEAYGKALLVLGMFLDFVLNLTWGTVLFLEFPKEFLLSPRVARHQDESRGYRQVAATWICHTLLDPFDASGCHCKKSLYD